MVDTYKLGQIINNPFLTLSSDFNSENQSLVLLLKRGGRQIINISLISKINGKPPAKEMGCETL